MSDALAYALRRYERTRPEPREKSDLLKAHALADWIERDVCPLVADLSRRPTFQTLARWPLDHLLPGAASAERRLIEAVDARLGTIAQALAAFAKKKAIARVLDRKLSAAAASVEAEKRSVNQKNSDVEVEFNAMAFNERRSLSGAPLMEFISRNPWRDLTSSLDFFSGRRRTSTSRIAKPT